MHHTNWRNLHHNTHSKPGWVQQHPEAFLVQKNLSVVDQKFLVKEGREWDATLPSTPVASRRCQRAPLAWPRREKLIKLAEDDEIPLRAHHKKMPRVHQIPASQILQFGTALLPWIMFTPLTWHWVCHLCSQTAYGVTNPQRQGSSPNTSKVMQEAQTGNDWGNYQVSLRFSLLKPLFKGEQDRRATPYSVKSHFPHQSSNFSLCSN